MTSAPWRSRIVRHADVDPTTLAANPANWRQHPKQQADALAGVLSEVGYVQSVIVNEASGWIVDGHLRVALAVERSEPTIPVVYVDLSDDEERLILATLDPLGAMAETDADALSALLDDVAPTSDDIRDLVSFLARRSGIGDMDDPSAEWVGMPSFEQEAAGDVYKSITVHFETAEDYAAFASLTSQNLTAATNFIWYPYKPTHGVGGSMKGYRVEDES